MRLHIIVVANTRCIDAVNLNENIRHRSNETSTAISNEKRQLIKGQRGDEHEERASQPMTNNQFPRSRKKSLIIMFYTSADTCSNLHGRIFA